MKKKVSLVLEGGGMRGAYTAGCLAWLIDNNIEFDAHYGISTGALHMCSYLLKNKEYLHELSTKYIADKSAIGFRSLFREGRIVSYDHLFNVVLEKKVGYDFKAVSEIKKNAKVGLYDMDLGKTVYYPIEEVGKDELKAACSLPIIGKVVESKGRKFLDGGITEMIPITPSIYDANDRHLVITTKPGDYVRKPAKKIVVDYMRLCYPECPEISDDYNIRHLNYVKQINLIKELVDRKDAVYMYPSETVKVSRLSGNPETLNRLYELGYSDMEKKKEEINALFK